MDTSNMATRLARKKSQPTRKPVQVSLDRDLLEQVDKQTGERGRSAFISRAIRLLLRAQREKAMGDQLRAAYEGKGDELWAEVKPWIEEQSWSPEDDLVETDAGASRPRQRERG
ncbi:MAG: hypothetical protein EXR72_09245 [Myxococcales bacterium]|nr:hypothetical protein [Myxococcales bacterium]